MQAKRTTMHTMALASCVVAVLHLAAAGTAWAQSGGGSDAAGKIAPPHSQAHGHSLTEWLKFYWTWLLEGADPSSGQLGRVMYLPMPDGEYMGGSATFDDPVILEGHLDITVEPGTPFVLPVITWIGERYPDGSVDEPLPNEWFGTYIDAELSLDGQPILENLPDYYVPATWFDEPIPSGGDTDYVFFQGVGFLCEPLEPGVHELTNYAYFLVPPNPVPAHPDVQDMGVIFDNTWTITVEP